MTTARTLTLAFSALSAIGLAAATPALAQPVKEDGQWRGSVNAGLSAASGNTTSASINASANATWADHINKFTASFTGLYGTETDNDGNKSTSNNLFRANALYTHNLNERVYTFGSLDLERNELQDLNFRSSIAGGMGYHVIRRTDETFNVFGGLSYNYERYKTEQRNYPELVLGQEWNRKVSDTVSFNERFAVYPNLGYPGYFRTQLDVGLTTKLSDRLNLNVSLQNRYQNHPVYQVKKMDTLFVTSIGYTFGAK
ncbi:DUF481 domain-containing protein [Chitinasiproducens palmae]|uniref:Salt-induced outer membrane protein YdiY n=1 Tax=Chitinasiproducens palmae TaxID=1770053 RepID=A0A1H2PN33_9BURK|nr:DUF481 domain-containing protein [Chitinasiproducens palmae]SDV47982.1 Putative salt-induced outer membrane protein YdiY [Chitinasiproducens palmae]